MPHEEAPRKKYHMDMMQSKGKNLIISGQGTNKPVSPNPPGGSWINALPPWRGPTWLLQKLPLTRLSMRTAQRMEQLIASQP